MNDVKSGSDEGLQGLVTVIVYVDFPSNPAKTGMVGNHKSIHPVVLRQIRIDCLELPYLLWIEEVDLPLRPAKAAVAKPSDGPTRSSYIADTIFSDNSIAPPRLFCAEKLECLLLSGFVR